MSLKRVIYVLILFGFFQTSCSEKPEYEYIAYVLEEGFMECFPLKIFNDDHTPVSCELSGVAYYHDSLFFVSDKRIPGTTSLFGGPFQVPLRRKDFTHYGQHHVLNAVKLEDMAVTPMQNYMFLTTGFDRMTKEPSDWDYYNMLITINLNDPKEEILAFETYRDGRSSSLKLRQQISRALRTRKFPQGPPYFKIGGLACTEYQFFIGVRESGKSYKDGEFQTNVIILGADYKVEAGELIFTSELKVLYRFENDKAGLIKEDIGLSGLEYDTFNNRLLLLTSFKSGKSDDKVGGYLWILPLDDFFLNKEPQLVRDLEGTPYEFAHKPEGVTVLDPYKVLVIHDDDRIIGRNVVQDSRTEFRRELNQAAFQILYFPN